MLFALFLFPFLQNLREKSAAICENYFSCSVIFFVRGTRFDQPGSYILPFAIRLFFQE
jgi:hypothetical protein